MLNRFLYGSYRFFYASSRWRSKRFTTGGVLVLAGLGVFGGFGLDTFRSMTYQAFTFLVSISAISMVWSLFFRVRFSINRKLPRFGTVGEPLTYLIEIYNLTKRKQSGLLLNENLGDPRPSLEDLVNTPEPEEKNRNIWDRKTLYFRWLWLISRNTKADVKEHAIPALPPGGQADVRAEILPLQRGPLYLKSITVSRLDPMGIVKSAITIPEQQSILVLPKRYPLPPIDLPGSRKYQPGGVSLASSVGNSEEFVSVRDYRPGDPLRQIHWKSWAKVGKPIIKEYQDEFFVRHALILDTFQQTAHNDIFEEAVSVAASFTSSVLTQESLLDLMFVGDKAYAFSSGRGIANIDKILEILASVTVCTNRSFSVLPPLVMEKAESLSGCICVLLSWNDERKDFIQALRAFGIPLIVLVITDDGSFAADPGPMKDNPENFHCLMVNNIKEGLARL